jgi:hypothetical protein
VAFRRSWPHSQVLAGAGIDRVPTPPLAALSKESQVNRGSDLPKPPTPGRPETPGPPTIPTAPARLPVSEVVTHSAVPSTCMVEPEAQAIRRSTIVRAGNRCHRSRRPRHRLAIGLAISSPHSPANKSGCRSVTHSPDVDRPNRGPNDLLAHSPAMLVGIEPQVRPTVLYIDVQPRLIHDNRHVVILGKHRGIGQ